MTLKENIAAQIKDYHARSAGMGPDATTVCRFLIEAIDTLEHRIVELEAELATKMPRSL